MCNMYINIENTIFKMLKTYIYPRKILLEEFKRLHAQSGILNNLNEKPNKLMMTKDN